MSDVDAWSALRRFTEARIGLGRTGAGLPTREVLRFAMSHAEARDAVRTPIDWTPIEDALATLDLPSLRVASAATDRETFLRRPDLGRRLDDASRARLTAASPPDDLLLVIADGLSSTAVAANAIPTVRALLTHVRANDWRLAPVLLATQSRVALADDAGGQLEARAALILIGERPGLSSPDSLGAYLTWAPRVGRKDGERNCISNIRQGGQTPDAAAFRISWLLREAYRRQLTGVTLKDESQGRLAAPQR